MDIENHDFLIDQATEIGVDKTTIGIFWWPENGKIDVAKAIQNTKEDFITVVPSLRLSNKFIIPGWQSEEAWINYIRRAAEIQNTN